MISAESNYTLFENQAEKACTMETSSNSAVDCSYFLSRCVLAGSASPCESRNCSDAKVFLKLICVAVSVAILCSFPMASGNSIHTRRQDLTTALINSKCDVRDVIIDIRTEHPEIRPTVKLRPACVKLRRCSGCCDSDVHVCKPTEIYVTEVEVSRQHTDGRVDYITLNFTEHAQCACVNPSNPCKPKICRHDQRWNVDRCTCESKCVPQKCGPLQKWSPQRCGCVCQNKCHPNRAVMLRFEQDHSTCVCVCRRAFHSRHICRRKRARFDSNTCTCIPSSSGRRAGRG